MREARFDINLRGPTRHEIYDISLKHLIEIKVIARSADSDGDGVVDTEAEILLDRTAFPKLGRIVEDEVDADVPIDVDGTRVMALRTLDNDDAPIEGRVSSRLITFDRSAIADMIRANADIFDRAAIADLPDDFAWTMPDTTGGGRRLSTSDTTNDKSESGDWSLMPPLSEREYWSVDGHELYARLVLDLIPKTSAGPLAAPKPTRFSRAGVFRVIGEPQYRFDGFEMSFSPVAEADLAATLAVLQLEGSDSTIRRYANTDPAGAAALTSLALSGGELDFEGNFSLDTNLAPDEKFSGWVWALIGPVTLIGFLRDPDLFTPRDGLVIMLPALSQELSPDGLPFNVSEKALLNRPDLFGDDPGTSCRPFDNPGRILGEKRFSTVLRVTQPYTGSSRVSLKPIDGDEEEGVRPVDYPRQEVSVRNPVDYESDIGQHQARSVAIGHILEHSVRYRSNGYSLGDVMYSMTLAPRQKRRIMKLDYSRTERSERDELTSLADEVADETVRERDYDNAVESQLDEWARGSSRSRTSAAAAGIGFASGPVIMGGGAVTASASSASQQSGGRTAAAAETQRLRDSIRRYGQSLRNFGSTVITETEQTESIEAVSEVVQNINYTRSLSILYYEILRHLRVDTEIAGVRECVFVPLPVRRFPSWRIVRYAHLLRRYARGWDERLAMRYPREAAFGFPQNHQLPAGRRADQKLDSISGSIYLQIGLAMPEDGPEAEEINKETDKTVYEREILRHRGKRWGPFSGFLPIPLPLILEKTVKASTQERNRYFQREIAPHMARRYLDKLSVKTGGGTEPLEADFTMVGTYGFGKTVRVDFTIDNPDTTTRADLETLVFTFDDDVEMPIKSYVNMTRCVLRYANEHYVGSARSDSGFRDLIDTSTGKSDSEGAKAYSRLTRSDKRNFREAAREGFRSLSKRIEQKRFYFNKVIWWSLDPDELYTLLDGYSISNEDGRSLASMIERQPLGIMGNAMVFQTSTDVPIDPLFDTFDALKAHYTAGLPKSDPMRISLPTDGVYARAHLDGCVAAEEHNGSFDWVFDNQEPELADFADNMFESRRAQPQNLAPTDMPDTIINLQNAPEAPSVSGLSDAFGAIQNAGAFRDMAGLSGTQANTRAALQAATSLAGNFGNMAFQQRMAQIAADAAAAKDVRAATSAVNHAVETGAVDKKTAEKTLGDYISRKLGGDPASGVAKNAKELSDKVLDLPSGGSITTVTGDGTQTVTRNGAGSEERDQENRPMFAGEGAIAGIADDRSPFQVEQYLKIAELDGFSNLLDSEKIHTLGIFAPYSEAEIAHNFPNLEEIEGTTPADQRNRARDRGFSFQTELATNRNAVVLSSSGGDEAQRVIPLNYLVYDFPVNGSDLFGETAEAFLRFLSRRADKLRKKDVTVKFSVVGRSDSAGKEENNEDLRKDRAENTWNRIASFGGLDSLDTTSQTLKSNATEFGRATNRSITIQEHFTEPPLNRPTFSRGKAQREDILKLALSMAKEAADKVPADGRDEPENRRTLAIDRLLRRYAENNFTKSRFVPLERFNQFWHKDFAARVITPSTVTKSNIVEDLNDMIRVRLDYDTRDNLITLGTDNAEEYEKINEQVAADLLDTIGDDFVSGWEAQTLVAERARQDLNPPAITGSGGTGPRWDVFRMMADMLEETSSLYKVTIDLKPE